VNGASLHTGWHSPWLRERQGALLRVRHEDRAAVEQLLADAVAGGKLPPTAVDRWRRLYESGDATLAKLRTMLAELP